jgi:FixJ family two-component response regulator
LAGLSLPLVSIIDDDESTRLAIASLLKLFGMRAETYQSVELFLQADGQDAADCIITDIQMPGLSGIDLKRILDSRACRTPVIMITGRPEVRLHEQALASGIVCLLNKPFDADALLACLKKTHLV